ncbi:unnamed protein product [Caenorhabditis angaria]|uniref:Uncharacterized protein n=1 Tax=Caenorhabditis angaria TaxID=860376 RepID=A0A9P1IVR3_9PELO|nr:unnamed protein product [Caenorhabditis angaria]
MSMDSNPVPGLPLLTEIFCNVTKVKKKKLATCDFPDALYTKKSFYGGIPGAGLGTIEILLVAIFVILSFKMKNDITKCFLTVVYIPLGISSIFKMACALYGTLQGAYGTFYMTFLMFYNFFYMATVVIVSIGSVIYLSGMIVIARKRQNFEMGSMWPSFCPLLLIGLLLSGSYTLVFSKFNQLPAAALFFCFMLSTIAVLVLLLVSICVGFICSKPKKSDAAANIAVDPVIYDARSRLGFGAGFVILMNIPVWFELYYKITELFCPYLWTDDAEKTVFYRAQSIEMLTMDTIRIFMSLFLLIAMFLNSSTRFAILSWKHHSFSKKNQKIFIATQKIPLLQENDKKPDPPVEVAPPPPPATIVPPPIQAPNPQQQFASGMSFQPGMVQFPQHMQTTIVYTPGVHPSGAGGSMTIGATPPGLIVPEHK